MDEVSSAREGRARGGLLLSLVLVAAAILATHPRILLAQGFIPLFVVNTYTSGTQTSPAVASNGTGDFLIVWRGTGPLGSAVYARRFAVGGGLTGLQYRVNTDNGSGQTSPAVAGDPAGPFLVVWGNGSAVTGRVFPSAGATFAISEENVSQKTSTAVATDGQSRSVVAWAIADEFGSGRGIYAQRLHGGSVLDGVNFRVNTYTTNYHDGAKVALARDGSQFVVVWRASGQNTSGLSVHGQRFTGAGSPIGGEFRVNTSSMSGLPVNVAVAMDASGRFLVAWGHAESVSAGSVWGQRFLANGAPAGGEFRVSSTAKCDYPAVGVDRAGRFVVAWNGTGIDGDSYGIAARRFDVGGSPVGAEFVVNGNHTTSSQLFPAVTLDGASSFVVAWMSYGQDGNKEGIAASFDPPVNADLRANTSTVGNQWMPSVATSGTGEFLVVWDGFLEDVFAQRFSAAGTPLAGELRVNTITTDTQIGSTVAGLPAGGFVVAWSAAVDAYPDYGGGIEAQRFAASGARLGGEFRVNAATTDGAGVPSIAADGTGRFAVVWQDGSNNIRMRRYDASGAAVASDAPIAAPLSAMPGQSVASDAAGNLVVVWQDTESAIPGQLVAQLFNAAGAQQGGRFRVNTYTPGAKIEGRAAFAASGSFMVVWSDTSEDGSGFGVFGQRFLPNGAPAGSHFRVNTVTTGEQSGPRIAARPLDQFVVTWSSDDGSDLGVFARRFSVTGVPLGAELRVNGFTQARQRVKGAAAGPGQFVAVWQSYLEGAGYGVYVGRVTIFPPGDVDGNGVVNASDVLYLINYLFAGGPAPVGPANVNGDTSVNVSDVLYLINHLFAGGPAPV